MPDVTVVRCPMCGSTDAGEDDGLYDLTWMRCGACGERELCDHYQIKDRWNVVLDLPADAVALPAYLPPRD